MYRLIIGALMFISPLSLLAHNPLSAMYYLESGDNIAMLTVSLSQVGVNQIMLKRHGEVVLSTMDALTYKEDLVEYVKSKFFLNADGQKVVLSEGGIKIGSHQTDLKFVLAPIATTSKNMVVDIPAFSENDNHQTIFSYNINGKKNKVILQGTNDYKATIALSEQVAWSAYGSLFIPAMTILGIIGIYGMYRQYKKKTKLSASALGVSFN